VALKKKINIEQHILNLLEAKSEINFTDVAEASGLSKTNEADRRAIGRSLKDLVDRGIIDGRGVARARTYFRKTGMFALPVPPQKVIEVVDDPFKEIQLSKESEKLIQYLSKAINARKPVGYNQDFLRSYVPNSTFYLNKSQRDKLLKIGKVEDKDRTAGTYARNILNRLLIDLSWNSSRLEGNTYSLLETKRLIESGESATGKDATETQMILNHKEAIEYIVNLVDEDDINSQAVRSIHALLSENFLTKKDHFFESRFSI
jgi:DNA-binding Lrp family transcriptional regulator